MSESKPFEERVLEAVNEIAEQYMDKIKVQLEGSTFGAHGLNDMQFAVWFSQMAAMNPNWVLALPYVEGGDEELRRYERIMAKQGVM